MIFLLYLLPLFTAAPTAKPKNAKADTNLRLAVIRTTTASAQPTGRPQLGTTSSSSDIQPNRRVQVEQLPRANSDFSGAQPNGAAGSASTNTNSAPVFGTRTRQPLITEEDQFPSSSVSNMPSLHRAENIPVNAEFPRSRTPVQEFASLPNPTPLLGTSTKEPLILEELELNRQDTIRPEGKTDDPMPPIKVPAHSSTKNDPKWGKPPQFSLFDDTAPEQTTLRRDGDSPSPSQVFTPVPAELGGPKTNRGNVPGTVTISKPKARKQTSLYPDPNQIPEPPSADEVGNSSAPKDRQSKPDEIPEPSMATNVFATSTSSARKPSQSNVPSVKIVPK